MFQVQLDHTAQRAVTFRMRDAMNDFLCSLRKEDEAMPGVERQMGVRIVIADRTGPEERTVEDSCWKIKFSVARSSE